MVARYAKKSDHLIPFNLTLRHKGEIILPEEVWWLDSTLDKVWT